MERIFRIASDPCGEKPYVTERGDKGRHRVRCVQLRFMRGNGFGAAAIDPCRISRMTWRTDDLVMAVAIAWTVRGATGSRRPPAATPR
ncbi:hypothetical protein, partial [Xanthomonas bonasiae]|uniref:hypothetical protein n=1 Tax=Xanthomonas bonasiae TaxID=2810351 RepID=UPI001CD8FC7A